MDFIFSHRYIIFNPSFYFDFCKCNFIFSMTPIIPYQMMSFTSLIPALFCCPSIPWAAIESTQRMIPTLIKGRLLTCSIHSRSYKYAKFSLFISVSFEGLFEHGTLTLPTFHATSLVVRIGNTSRHSGHRDPRTFTKGTRNSGRLLFLS